MIGNDSYPTAEECVMRNDGEKAVMWPVEHWALAKWICVGVVLLGMSLAGLELMTWRAAFVASILGIAYVLLLTRHYTRGGATHPQDHTPAP